MRKFLIALLMLIPALAFAGSTTTNFNLYKPAAGEKNWATQINQNFDTIDTQLSTIQSSSMVYPGAGIPLSTGNGWTTSITNNSANWNTAYGWGDHSQAGYVPSIRTVNGKALSSNITLSVQGDIDASIYALDTDLNVYALQSSLASYVPTSRTINGKSLSSNVVIGQNDIDLSLYVPKTTTVNGQALSGNITIATGSIGTTVTGDFTVTGNLWSDSITIDGGIYPMVDNVYDIGSAAKSFHDIYADGTLYATNLATTGNGTLQGTAGFTNNIIYMNNYSNTVEIDNNLYTGSIGIGTPSPRGSLDVQSSPGVDGFIYGNGANLTGLSISGGTSIFDVDTKVYVIDGNANSANSRIGFNINGSNSIIIDQNGNVGIGTSAPNVKLRINGGISTTGNGDITAQGTLYAAGGGVSIVQSVIRSTAGNDFSFGAGGRSVISVDSALYGTAFNYSSSVSTDPQAAVDVGWFNRTSLPPMASGSKNVGIAGSVEIDSNIYVDTGIYMTATSGNSALYLRSPDNTCAKCALSNAETFFCTSITCGAGM